MVTTKLVQQISKKICLYGERGKRKPCKKCILKVGNYVGNRANVEHCALIIKLNFLGKSTWTQHFQ